MHWTSARFALLLVWLAAAFTPAHADSWAPPTTETVTSASGAYRLTVEPSPLDSALAYFQEEVEADREGRTVERPAPMAVLAHRQADRAWETVWGGPLVNAVAPMSLMVSDRGHAVTFDNWHSVGHGEHVVVIYSPTGELVRSMPLTALLPQDYIDALPHSVSSLSWREDARFSPDGATLLVDVLVPSADEETERTVPFAIRLADGAVTLPPAEQWHAALAGRDEVLRQRSEAEAAHLAYLRQPLAAPASCNTDEWHEYLREAHARLTPLWLDAPVAAILVLFAADNPRHRESVGWLVEAIEDEAEFPGELAVAAPCHDAALPIALEKAFRTVKPGTLSQSILYLTAGPALRGQLEPIVSASGARVVWLDPGVPITQRAERVPGSPEAARADAERQRRQEAGMRAMLDDIDAS